MTARLASRTLAAVLLVTLAFAPARAATDRERLRELEHAYATGSLNFHPERDPAGGTESGYTPPSTLTLASERRWLESLARRLTEVKPSALAAPFDLSREALAARIAGDLDRVVESRPWERDPAEFLRAWRTATTGAASGGPCEALRRATRHLEAGPEVLRAAVVALVAPDRAAVTRALTDIRDALQWARSGLSIQEDRCRDDRAHARFAQAESSAVGSLVEFGELLEEQLLARATAPRPLGGTRLIAWWRATEAESLDVDAALARALEEFAGDDYGGSIAERAVEPLADSAAAARGEAARAWIALAFHCQGVDSSTLAARISAARVFAPASEAFELARALSDPRVIRPAMRRWAHNDLSAELVSTFEGTA
ncbi:MAG: hypothetical protein HOP12_09175, partial [Candidatus Eisenbacteria bacterium]|nr:hypothetical protein [Candidatus Eisenbacteria bacterium]